MSSRSASIAASRHTASNSAPDSPSVLAASASKSTDGASGKARVWMCKISRRAERSGSGTNNCTSRRPGLFRARRNAHSV